MRAPKKPTAPGKSPSGGKKNPDEPAFLGECVVPRDVRQDYSKFLEWCSQHNIMEIGHTVAPMSSSLLRAKPTNIKEFSEEQFLKGSELDGSSFATGGGRVVNRSKVIAIPDPQSKWFIFPDPVRRKTLHILSEMVTPEGTPIGGRKPLRVSSQTLEKTIDSLAKTLGLKPPGPNEKYALIAGFEKEFFIIPKGVSETRPDLKYLGMTVVGGPGPIHQNLQGVYATIPKIREEALLDEIVAALSSVGITIVQKHMEVGQTGNELNGRQCEVVLKYAPALNAADNELICRQVIEDVCERHNFRALLGSKPFTEDSHGEGINGSGKHTNVSLVKYDVVSGEIIENLLSLSELAPGEHSQVNLIGIAMVAALGRHWAIYDASIASRSNELRRRPGYEAPVYLNAFIGSTAEFRDSLIQDRNRSVSIGLSGDKLEWRAPGANTAMYYPLAFLNLGFNEVLKELDENIRGALKRGVALDEAIRLEFDRLRQEVDYFVVDEDVYELTKAEAQKRFNYKAPENTYEALESLDKRENLNFLLTDGVFTEEMLKSYRMVQLETYIARVRAESIVLLQMCISLSNKVFKSDLMRIPPGHLGEVEMRLRERQVHLGSMNAELLTKTCGSCLCKDEKEKSNNLRFLLEKLRQIKDSEEMARLIIGEVLPLIGEIRHLYEQIVEILGGSEEVANL